MSELLKKFPRVFVIGIDEHNNEICRIKTNATLKDLFDAYSEIVHSIDGEIIIILEELITKKIEETTI